ncbi:hypothetical protein [Paenibacillus glucanolyticus]|uniref:hypothetical protein n=1 Tax=Paenibacillus glucanolyticus TaxID=59843 RepID=UPI0034CE8CD4
MKHRLFGKLALSAALLGGTAALPVHASGADTPGDVSSQTGKSAPAETIEIAAVHTLPNPLELAEKYAPETVQDWKETLEKYGKLAGAEGTFQFAATTAAATVRVNDDSKPGEVKDPVEATISFKATPAKDIQELIDSGEIKEFIATGVNDVGMPPEGVTIQRTEAVKAGGGEAPSSFVPAGVEGTKAVKISDEDLAFIHARVDLFKAADSKDSAAIQEALTKLLNQYKEQITKLEAEAK